MTAKAENLKEEMEQKKKEQDKVRTELHSKYKAKEGAFKELSALRENIKSHNLNIKVIKKERDDYTKEVRALKEEREKLNQAVKEKLLLKKEADSKSNCFQKSGSLLTYQTNLRKLKSMISELELKLETEVMPFSLEQALNKKLKAMIGEYKVGEKNRCFLREINSINQEFRQKKKQAQKVHQEVQKKAQQSEEKHQQICTLLEKIKQWRVEEKGLVEISASRKLEYEQAKSKLEEISQQIQCLRETIQEKQLLNFKSKAKEKTLEVEEKIKLGKKLSVEDILAFQAIRE